MRDTVTLLFDGGLWDGIKANYKNKAILDKTHIVKRIKNIDSYEIYLTIISGIKMICKQENWSIIEVEKIWQGTKH